MSTQDPSESLLLIRCPSCSQRFKVSETLMHRTVECGSCEHRFMIEQDVVARGKNFRAGSPKSAHLGKFQRIEPLGHQDHLPAGHVEYGAPPDPSKFEPTSPLRIFAAAIGSLILLLFITILIVGAKRAGILDGVTTERRLIMAGFAALLGSGLILYGNPKSRIKALIASLLASALLVSLPFLFQEGSQPLESGMVESAIHGDPDPFSQTSAVEKDIPLAERIGTDPLVTEIELHQAEGTNKTAIGLWLKKLMPNHRFLVREFTIRTLNASHETHFYNRGTYEFLLVVTGTDTEFAKIPELMKPLGEITNIYPDLSVIEIEVDNSNFVEGPSEKLTNREDPAFYELNKRELDSIDLDRVEKAVRRLMDTSPEIYLADINKRLVSLLEEEDVDFKGEVARALKRWSVDPVAEGRAAMVGLDQLLKKKKKIPKEIVELCIKSDDPAIIPHLDTLWRDSVHDWEYVYSLAGPRAEDTVRRSLEETTGMNQQSAIRILGKIGTESSIPILQNYLNHSNAEVKLLTEKAITSIQERMQATPDGDP